jgi:protein O-GlcNAc transferase
MSRASRSVGSARRRRGGEGPCRRWTRPWAASFLLGFLLTACAGSDLPELEPVPTPDLSAADPAVREQIAEKRDALDRALDRVRSEPAVAAGAFGELGLVYVLYDFLDAAGVCFDNARRLDPGDFRWTYLAGYLRQVEGRLPQAVPLLERTTEMEPDFMPAHLRLGRARLEMGQTDRAEEHFRRALEVDPKAAAAFEGLGRVAAAHGDDSAAVESFRRALELEPEASGVRYALGQSLRRQGEIEAATRELEQAGDVPTRIPDPLINPLAVQARSEQFYAMQGAEALEDEDYESAAGAFRALLEQNPESFPGYRGLAQALSGMGDPEGAAETLREALEKGATERTEGAGEGTEGSADEPARDAEVRAQILRELAGLETGLGDEPAALDHLKEALELEPDQVPTRVRAGDLLARSRRFEEALEQFDRALELDPDGPGASAVRVRRATVLVNLKRGEEAVAEFRRAVELTPEDPVVHHLFGETLEFLGRGEEAAEQRRLAEELSDSTAQKVRLLLREAQDAIHEEGFETALERYREVIELAPDYVPAREGRARVLGHLGRYDEAVEEFDRALERAPRDLSLHRGRIRALVLGERWGEARVALNDTLRLFPREKDLALLQVRLLATAPEPRVRDGELALEVAHRVARDDERGVATRQALALAMAEGGRFDEAAGLQRELVAEAERAGSTRLLPRLRDRLEAFEAGRAWVARGPEEILEF